MADCPARRARTQSGGDPAPPGLFPASLDRVVPGFHVPARHGYARPRPTRRAVSDFSGIGREAAADPSAGLARDADPVISPDGGLLVFRRDATPASGEFYRLKLKDGKVSEGDPVRLTSMLYAGKPVWIPDSREIIFRPAEGSGDWTPCPGARHAGCHSSVRAVRAPSSRDYPEAGTGSCTRGASPTRTYGASTRRARGPRPPPPRPSRLRQRELT